MQRTCRHQSFPTPLTTLTFSGILGSLSNDNGDGYENVTYKVNLRCLKLNRTYSISLNSSNVGTVFWSWILTDCIKVQEKKKKRCCLLLPSSTKREIRQFHVAVVQRRQKNVQKNVMHVQSCCFACLNLLLFCRSCCRRRRRYVNSLLVSTDSNISGVLLSAKYLFDKVTVA